MNDREEYVKPAFRTTEACFEYSLLQSTGADRADDGYNTGMDLGDLD